MTLYDTVVRTLPDDGLDLDWHATDRALPQIEPDSADVAPEWIDTPLPDVELSIDAERFFVCATCGHVTDSMSVYPPLGWSSDGTSYFCCDPCHEGWLDQ